MIEFTTVVALDQFHQEELAIAWPTWKAFRPEILKHPLLVICDADVPVRRWLHWLAFLDHPDRRLVGWNMKGVEQREKMLSGLVFATARHVDTPWYLKLDAHTLAIHGGRWLQSWWFAADAAGRLPVFVSAPWSYTKPADAIQRLDRWGDATPLLRERPPLDLKPDPGAALVRHARIGSWCFFGQTAWTRAMAAACPHRLPLPSQDTFLWYCAARRGEFFRRVSMQPFGWRHVPLRKALRAAASRALAAAMTPSADRPAFKRNAKRP